MKRLVIANRGEIARRVMRAARKRSYSVAVVSTSADASSLVRREADAVLEVPSFLDGPAIVAAAHEWGAGLLHPGYGYLSEIPEFAAAVESAGIAFVGPTADSMRALGGKESARRLAASCGVPTLPALLSSELATLPPREWQDALAARGITAPYLVKASAGGGGRGMRVVEDAAALPDAVARASDEARAAFGDGTVFIERLLARPRHVEIQVFGDGHGGGVFWGERECSLQRRHQKVVEEAPSSVVDASLRERLGRAALALVGAASYRNAGTVEFLLDEDGSFFFLEANTRLQVEHPVTEMVYGIDLVDAQLELAEGRWPASFPAPDVFVVPTPHGQAFEARVLAEDPRHGFLPTPGLIHRYREPVGEGVRVDTGVAGGCRVTTAFDSLLAKVIVHGPDRATALDRLAAALEGLVIQGPTTNIPLLHAMAVHPDLREGRISTPWIAEHLDELNVPRVPSPLAELLSSSGFAELVARALAGDGRALAPHVAVLARQEQAFPSFPAPRPGRVDVLPLDRDGTLRVEGPGLTAALAAAGAHCAGHSPRLRDLAALSAAGSNPAAVVVASRVSPTELAVTAWGDTWTVEDPRAASGVSASAASSGEVRAPMAGKVVEVRVAPGDTVATGHLMFVVESMKMQLEVRAAGAATVREVLVTAGQVLTGPDVLATLTAT